MTSNLPFLGQANNFKVESLKNCYEALMEYVITHGADKVRIFWEGHKILQNLHLTFVYSTQKQK